MLEHEKHYAPQSGNRIKYDTTRKNTVLTDFEEFNEEEDKKEEPPHENQNQRKNP